MPVTWPFFVSCTTSEEAAEAIISAFGEAADGTDAPPTLNTRLVRDLGGSIIGGNSIGSGSGNIEARELDSDGYCSVVGDDVGQWGQWGPGGSGGGVVEALSNAIRPRTVFTIVLTTGRARLISCLSMMEPGIPEVLLPPNRYAHRQNSQSRSIIRLCCSFSRVLPTIDLQYIFMSINLCRYVV